MSIQSKIFTGLAALALTCAGATVLSATPASAVPHRTAATPACGSVCTAISVQMFGHGYVTAVSGTPKVGAGIVLADGSPTANEDFTLHYEGTVAQFYSDGIVNSVVGTTWPTDDVYEYVYTPDGHESSLCIGTASTAVPGLDLTLQKCGVDAETCWIALTIDNIGGWEPLIAATDTVLNTPYVMTAIKVGAPITTQQMYLVKGTFSPVQMWADVNGVL
jgi:hypothetical protein